MRENANKLVANIIAAHGGELVGRIRIQKVVYLLDQLGLGADFDYSYHHYGPYSEELSSALIGAQMTGLVEDEQRYRRSDGAAYSVFKTTLEPRLEDFEDIGFDKAVKILDRFKREKSTILELAATIHWLKHIENVDDWEAELKSRKGSKTEDGRQESAVRLLSEIGLF